MQVNFPLSICSDNIALNANSSQDDLSALERGQDLVRMVIPDIVNSVYKKLLQHDVTARVFSTRDSRDDEDPPMWPQDGSPAIQNRKIFLRWYLTRLNQDPSKKEFVRPPFSDCVATLTDDMFVVGVLGQSRVC